MPFGLDPASDGFQNLVNRLFQGVGVKLLLDGAASLENELLELLVLEELVLVGLVVGPTPPAVTGLAVRPAPTRLARVEAEVGLRRHNTAAGTGSRIARH